MNPSRFFLRSLLLVCFTVLFVTCKKDEETDPEQETAATSQGSFTWTTSSGGTVTADSAYYYAQFTTIYAFKNGLNQSIEVNLSALSAGSYSLSSSTGNALTYVSGSTTYGSTSGSLTISSAANTTISGSFNAVLSGGSITSISGSFQDIHQR